MYASYTLNKEELNFKFFKSLKNMLKDGEVLLTIENYDETEYLMKSPKNREILLKSIKNIDNEQNLVELPIEEIERMINETDNI